jgi:hypothetical protein
MKAAIVAVIAAFGATTVVADSPKLNQYRNLDDW